MKQTQKFMLFSLSDNSDKNFVQMKVDEMLEEGWEVESININAPDRNNYRCWMAITFRQAGYKHLQNLPGIK